MKIKNFWICVASAVYALSANSCFAETITGAGSSAAAPLYSKWAAAYSAETGIGVDYQSIGSSAGIKKIKEHAVDFGASDAPMSEAELNTTKLLHFPTVISGVVPFVNLPGIKPGQLKLTPEILVGIYSGLILKWDDAEIAKANPGLTLPKQIIVPLARQDGSGTTFTLTDYFSRVSAVWRQQYGTKFTISWPLGIITVKGSKDLVATVKKTPGAIGYVEYAYVIENNLTYTKLRNRAGNFVNPNAASFRAALKKSGWENTGNFGEMLTDKPGLDSWPITGSTYVYVPQITAQPESTTAALQFFTWAFLRGDAIANSLDYIRLPDRVQSRVFHQLVGVVDSQGKRLDLKIELR